MTVSQEMYGNARLERKNIPPPLSLSGFNYPSMTLQQQHINLANTVPKSAPPQSSNNDFMQTVSLADSVYYSSITIPIIVMFYDSMLHAAYYSRTGYLPR